MEWLFIALAIMALSMLQTDQNQNESVAVCVLASCNFITSEDAHLGSEPVALSECEQALLDSSSCPEPTP